MVGGSAYSLFACLLAHLFAHIYVFSSSFIQVGDITHVNFFPSGSVLLSASIDLSLRIWAIDQAVTALHLSGAHNRTISSVQLLGRGRQFMTASLDGTVKVWDTAVQKSIHSWKNKYGREIHSAVILDPSQHPYQLSPSSSDHSVSNEFAGHLLVTGDSNGSILSYDLRQSTNMNTTSEIELNNSIQSFDAVSKVAQGGKEHIIIVGSQTGTIAVVDLRMNK